MTIDFFNTHETIKNLEERLTAEVNSLSSSDTTALIEGDFVQYLSTLYNDYISSQRFTDPHDVVYGKRLLNEMRMMDCCEHLKEYFKSRNPTRFIQILLLQLRLV